MKLELEKLIKFCSFVCLCIIAIFFMKQVIEQFNSNDTSLKMSEVEITHFPTFTICLHHVLKTYRYNEDFTILYNNVNLSKSSDFEVEYSEYEFYYYEDDEYVSFAYKIKLQEVYSYMQGSNCYKIKQVVDKDESINPEKLMVISVEFHDTHVSFEELPKIELFVTSKSNSDGVIFKEWMDGTELRFIFQKV